MTTQYRFLHRGRNNRYYWQSTTRVDSRVEQISCDVDWFWSGGRLATATEDARRSRREQR